MEESSKRTAPIPGLHGREPTPPTQATEWRFAIPAGRGLRKRANANAPQVNKLELGAACC